jgi:hypothetical protein
MNLHQLYFVSVFALLFGSAFSSDNVGDGPTIRVNKRKNIRPCCCETCIPKCMEMHNKQGLHCDCFTYCEHVGYDVLRDVSKSCTFTRSKLLHFTAAELRNCVRNDILRFTASLSEACTTTTSLTIK